MKLTQLFGLSALAFAASACAQTTTLTVYTYDSFTSDWGPGPKLEKLFEKSCHCDVKFVPLEDGITMFNRIRLEGKKTKADVMLGLDNFALAEAEKSNLFVPHQLKTDGFDLPQAWSNVVFYPYDYGEFAFVYNKQKVANPPKSLKELVERQDLRVIYQDPRTSTVGRGLLYWVNGVYGDKASEAWQTLAKHTVTVGKGWSETYGVFLKGESDVVLSYSTSPLYHQWHEKDENYVAANFEEGHLAQVEVAAVTKESKNPELARQFLAFLTSPEAQKIISYNNVMKPVVSSQADPLFKTLPVYKTLEMAQPSEDGVKAWLNNWQQAVSK